ncbi:hypothetical protein [Leucobacter sp. wl10]|uniref:hypothetical protein n=1 Tax=Leucobacter sp. wl10 TaxID=2304677 RepID=UPI000E5B695D|nr:hypothetical protein [Leucobacter sp. wl10]RGE21592.1 hypothetical protein D1J51_07130 [Leucobacter sp. wl10]
MASGSAHPSGSWRARVRGAGAAGAALVLLGTAALSPFSVAAAFADAGSAADRGPQRAQGLDAARSAETVVDTGVSAAEPGGAGAAGPSGKALYTLQQFMFMGAVNWQGYKFTFYSQQVLPGTGLDIPGRRVNADGYVSDADGYIVLAGSAPKGTVYDTPFGYRGKIYDRGTVGNHLDVYIR